MGPMGPSPTCYCLMGFYCMPNNNRFDGPNGPVPRFKRNFVSCGACIHIAFGCGIRFNGIDAGHSKHSVYRQGLLHILSTRDGNNKILPLCWATCETESGDTYEFMADEVHNSGLSRYLNKESVTFSDRQKGLEQFHKRFKSHVGRCLRHIKENARTHLRGSGQVFQDKTIAALQRAETKVEWDAQMEVLRLESELTAEYFTHTVVHDEVYQYAFNQNGVATHGHKTSNIAESANFFLDKARHEAPYRRNDEIATWLGKEFAARTETMRKWVEQGHFLTPYTRNLFATEVCAHMPHMPPGPICPLGP